MKAQHKVIKIILFFVVIIFAVLYSLLALVRHNAFQSGGFDLGIFDQAVWQYSRFQYPYNTVKERFILGDHLTLNLPLLSPLFWFYDDVRMLLVFQAAAVALAGAGIFLLSQKRLKTTFVSFSVMFAFYLFYGVQYAIYFDFHPIVYGMTLLVFLALAVENNNRFWTAFLIILTLTTQENMGIALLALSLFYLVRRDKRLTGLTLGLCGLIYTLLAGEIIAFLSPVGFQYQPEIVINPLTVLRRFTDTPEKLEVWKYTLFSYGFLPFFYPPAVMGVFLDMYQYLATGQAFSRMWSPFMHHRIMLSPILAIGTIELLNFLKGPKLLMKILAVYLVLFSIAVQYYFHLPLNKLSKQEYWKREAWMDQAQKLFAKIPQAATLATQQNFVPHLSHRQQIYLVYPRKRDLESAPCGEKTCWWLEWGGNPEYLLVDTRPNQWLTQILEANENWQSAINNMEKNGKLILTDFEGATRLYRVIAK
jgi:uncharacterized membrane protein